MLQERTAWSILLFCPTFFGQSLGRQELSSYFPLPCWRCAAIPNSNFCTGWKELRLLKPCIRTFPIFIANSANWLILSQLFSFPLE